MCVCSDLFGDGLIESKLEAVMALAVLLQVCYILYNMLCRSSVHYRSFSESIEIESPLCV